MEQQQQVSQPDLLLELAETFLDHVNVLQERGIINREHQPVVRLRQRIESVRNQLRGSHDQQKAAETGEQQKGGDDAEQKK
jgi:hypothetical protein